MLDGGVGLSVDLTRTHGGLSTADRETCALSGLGGRLLIKKLRRKSQDFRLNFIAFIA